MNNLFLIQTLTESFLALSDEVQSLIDRKTVLEHKLRYAHEQYQYLADKYAPAVSEVSETVAKLQLPPDLQYPPATSAVPLPKRCQSGGSQHQIALLIREGRKAAQELVAAVLLNSGGTEDGLLGKERPLSSGIDMQTSSSTVLERDFTVEGKKGVLACPFSSKPNQDGNPPSSAERVDDPQDPAGVSTGPNTPHPSDPICAAMLDDASSPPAPVASKCPIRFLDKHSPEEVARYVEMHKHQIPRSHEVCVRRYQRNEEQIRKLDAKYGSLVNMVKDLSQLHRPMLPPTTQDREEADRASNKRVEDWARTVEAGDPGPENPPPVDDERESRFDRPLRDVRVGESPSRPWGISVPVVAAAAQRRPSATGSLQDGPQVAQEPAPARKCPFDHSKLGVQAAVKEGPEHGLDAPADPPPSPLKQDVPSSSTRHPTVVNLPELPAAQEKGERPQIVFNISGPVFIGYPMEQAVEFLQRMQERR
ncbi:hypothetical protein VTK26DRAFT_2145 [Humicola hyalothermophila]